jgi:hypothetical protein
LFSFNACVFVVETFLTLTLKDLNIDIFCKSECH